MNKYEAFWQWFIGVEERYYYEIETHMEKLVPMLQNELSKINNHIVFEIGEVLANNKRDFVISADGVYSAFDDVITLYDYRLELSKWNIIPFRAPEEVISHSVELDGLILSYRDISFDYNIINSLIDITVYINNYDKKDNRYVHAYFLLLDSLVGEYDAVTLFGETVILKKKTEEKHTAFIELKEIVDKLKIEVFDQELLS